MWYPIVLAVLAGYFLGNLNGAVTMSVLNGREDVRKKGSGNAGLTNYFRSYGSRDIVCVMGIDIGKTVLGCLLGGCLLKAYGCSQLGAMVGGFSVILGHNFPLLLGFRGGKGIICSAFLTLMVDWRVFLILACVFFSLFFATHYVSLASCVSAVTLSVVMSIFYWTQPWMVVLSIAVGALALFMHRENLARLIKGTERKTYLHKNKG